MYQGEAGDALPCLGDLSQSRDTIPGILTTENAIWVIVVRCVSMCAQMMIYLCGWVGTKWIPVLEISIRYLNVCERGNAKAKIVPCVLHKLPHLCQNDIGWGSVLNGEV